MTNSSFTHHDRIAVHLTPTAERAIRRGHPWVYQDGIRKQSQSGHTGDLAVIFDRKRKFLAAGIYDAESPIRIRVLIRQPATINDEWLATTVAAIVERRRVLIDQPYTTGYRLINGENDGLPGVVLDFYAGVAVLKLDSGAWCPHLSALVDAVRACVLCETVVLRLSRSVDPLRAGSYGDGAVLVGKAVPSPHRFRENGLWFEVDPVHGQKTGFFLDQRENRQRVADLASGMSVLDLFSCNGGFSIYAAHGGAKHVTSVDISAPAIAAAQRNFQYNKEQQLIAGTDHHGCVGDVFEILHELADAKRRFDLVIVDPPPFARKQRDIERALHAYSRLTELALSVSCNNGLLVAASCSSRVTADAFFGAVYSGADNAKRRLIELERTGHPVDHPIGFAEGAYLKCMFARVP